MNLMDINCIHEFKVLESAKLFQRFFGPIPLHHFASIIPYYVYFHIKHSAPSLSKLCVYFRYIASQSHNGNCGNKTFFQEYTQIAVSMHLDLCVCAE